MTTEAGGGVPRELLAKLFCRLYAEPTDTWEEYEKLMACRAFWRRYVMIQAGVIGGDLDRPGGAE